MRRPPIFIGLGLALLLFPCRSDAGFPTPPSEAQAWLYETAERVAFDLEKGVIFRHAVSPLMGFTLVGTPLCPSAMLANVPGLAHCTVIGVGTSTLDARTGKGPTSGTFDVVVDIPANSSVHVPDLPVISGTFRGDITSVPGLPLLSLVARFRIRTVDARDFPGLESLVGRSVSVTGSFRIPVGPAETSGLCPAACYLVEGGLVPVQDAELSLGFALVRLEIQFGEIEQGGVGDDRDDERNHDGDLPR
jgi:hypothetical protein